MSKNEGYLPLLTVNNLSKFQVNIFSMSNILHDDDAEDDRAMSILRKQPR